VAKKRIETKEQFVLTAVDALRIKLLDLTGGNQLLSFKHSERSKKHVRVVDAAIEFFYEQLNDGTEFRFYPIPEPDDKPPDEKTGHFRRALETAMTNDAQYQVDLRNLGDNPAERSRSR
jgi:Protein of unknown function (DUF4011)